MFRPLLVFATVLTCGSSAPAFAAFPSYAQPTIYARSGVTGFNLPAGSSTGSSSIRLNDDRQVALDVNFVGNTGNPGVFFGEYDSASPTGQIVFNANDTIGGNPQLNQLGQAVFSVGFSADTFVYDHDTQITTPINYPLGITGSTNLTLTSDQQLAGRLAAGFSGNVYGAFPRQSAGLPTATIYATDDDIDASSPYSFLYSPAVSQPGDSSAPRIASKVSTTAGFDFEEIRFFEADGSTSLIATETEIDPNSTFSEFITNSVSISNDGSQVAFQANDLQGVSGVYRYDDQSGSIKLIASESGSLVDEIDTFSPTVNDDGLVTFRGDDGNGLSSVFVGDGDSLLRLAGEGDLITTDLGVRQLGRRDMDFGQAGAPTVNNQGDVGFLFQYFDPANPASVADGTLVMVATFRQLDGDFDGNGIYDCSDIDPLIAEIALGSNDEAFDLTSDGLVTNTDRDAWLDIAGAAQLGPFTSYQLGDADLDGDVDGRDFLIWNINKTNFDAAWCNGDFNADGHINGQDFDIWSQHKFTSAGAVAVPESNSAALLLATILAAFTQVGRFDRS